MGLTIDFSWKNIGVLKCIPGVNLPKYTYSSPQLYYNLSLLYYTH